MSIDNFRLISNNDISGNMTDSSGNTTDSSENMTDSSENMTDNVSLFQTLDKKQHLDKQKKQWIDYCDLLLRTLKRDKNLVSLKLNYVRFRYDSVHIYVIIISSILTCIETIKMELDILPSSSWDSMLSLFTLFCTMSVVVSMSITKYLRYSETIQNILIVSNEGVGVIYKLREAMEETATCEKMSALRVTILKNKKEAITSFYKVQQEIDRLIPINERVKYNKQYENELKKEATSRKKIWKSKHADYLTILHREKDNILKETVNESNVVNDEKVKKLYDEIDKRFKYIYGDPYGDSTETAWIAMLEEEKDPPPAKYILPLIMLPSKNVKL